MRLSQVICFALSGTVLAAVHISTVSRFASLDKYVPDERWPVISILEANGHLLQFGVTLANESLIALAKLLPGT